MSHFESKVNTKHCCSANRAVERCCVFANAMVSLNQIGHHTHKHTHIHSSDPTEGCATTPEGTKETDRAIQLPDPDPD